MIKKNRDVIQTIKYESTEDIIKFIIEMSQYYNDMYSIFLEVIQERQSLFTISEVDKEKVLQAIFLSLVLASVGSNLYNPYARETFIQKIKSISADLGLEYRDLVRLTQYEARLLALMEQ
jgi:hypothetical protein